VVIVNVYKGRVGVVLTASLLLTAWCGAAPAQQQKDSSQSQVQQPATDSKATDAAAKPAKAMTPAEARQAQLQADTERLYQLTQELKDEVAKSNKDTLSIPVIKKAEEVEKLARSLKERMRQPQ
jgi:hypothetical protein